MAQKGSRESLTGAKACRQGVLYKRGERKAGGGGERAGKAVKAEVGQGGEKGQSGRSRERREKVKKRVRTV